jgi:carbonic anhydrase
MNPMSETDRLLANARAYAPDHERYAGLAARPASGVAIVTCMDARIDVYRLFGLSVGEAHVIRNAGGLVTDDALRSLAISQRFLGTREVVLVHHTGCGMQGLDADSFLADLERETGVRPAWSPGGFDEPQEDVRRSVAAVLGDPFVVEKGSVRGFVFDVATGRLEEV